jgi:nicotinamide phosphoribosyltransferase
MNHRYIPTLLCDFYKISHREMYPKGTEKVYSTWIPRASRYDYIDEVVAFGFQQFLMKLNAIFEEDFFSQPKEKVVAEYARTIKYTLGVPTCGDCEGTGDSVREISFGKLHTFNCDACKGTGTIGPDASHIEALHDLGYLPIHVKALDEGTLVPLRVPMLTIENTLPEFFWVTNYIESYASCELWQATTSATLAHEFRKVLDHYALLTVGNTDFVQFQGHDFAMRGMSSLDSAITSGMGHLLSFVGTDTIPAINAAEYYYGANIEQELIGTSIPASEHSIQCTYEDDYEYLRTLLEDVHPNGFVSIVSDGYDFWDVVGRVLPALRDKIMARSGGPVGDRVVIRPDSGDPVLIVCGDPKATPGSLEFKGAVEALWDIFGGTVSEQGYKILDPHIGLIYGDAISIGRCREICDRLAAKGFASINCVYGIGSYCVNSDVPILCSDLVWRKAGTLEVGQEIIAFDEDPSFGEGNGAPKKHAARRYKLATITANTPAMKHSIKVTTDIGQPITASTDHPWLVWTDHRTLENTIFDGVLPNVAQFKTRRDFPRSPGLAWKRTNELVPGDKITYFGDSWEVEDTYSAGWLAGMYDGEGSLSQSTENSFHFKVNVSQNAGPLLDRLEYELKSRGFDFYRNDHDGCPQLVILGGFYEALRFLGTIRPERLLNKLSEISIEMPALLRDKTFTLAEVQSVEDVGMAEVASISTSAGTFITGGYLSHNTYQYNTRDTFGFALKSTLAVIRRTCTRCDGTGSRPLENPVPGTVFRDCEDCHGEGSIPVEKQIFKDPKTDDGVKKSMKGKVMVFNVGNPNHSAAVGCICQWDKGIVDSSCTEAKKSKIWAKDGYNLEAESTWDLLQTIYLNGKLTREQTFSQIRGKLNGN